MIYEICVTGFETYDPALFETDDSVEKFRTVVSEFIDQIVKELDSESNYGGHDIKDRLVPMLIKHGYKEVIPNSVIDLKGECFYSNRHPQDKPDIISTKTWDKIIEHNSD
jgi:hypothetical protein